MLHTPGPSTPTRCDAADLDRTSKVSQDGRFYLPCLCRRLTKGNNALMTSHLPSDSSADEQDVSFPDTEAMVMEEVMDWLKYHDCYGIRTPEIARPRNVRCIGRAVPSNSNMRYWAGISIYRPAPCSADVFDPLVLQITFIQC